MQQKSPKSNILEKIKILISKPYFFKFLISIFLILSISTTLVYTHYLDLEKKANSNRRVEKLDENKIEENESSKDTKTEETQPEETVKDEEDTSTTKPKVTSKEAEDTGTDPEPETPDPEPETPDPEPETPESPSAVVAFYADNQSDTDEEDLNHQRVVTYILNSGANPVFHAGDLMEDGTQDSLDRFNTITATLRATRTFYAALGNNDREVGDPSTPSQLFLDNFVFPNNEQWYSVNYGNLHLIVLDSAFSSGSATQLNWLVSDLQSSNSQNKITGVMFHHPTFSSTISQRLIDNGADFVIAGHVHSYSHSVSNGINYFTLSGQPSLGYMIARVYSDTISFTVYNNGNGVIDTVEFNER